jgi:ankyrin repeat protein
VLKVLWRAVYPLHHACSNGRLQDIAGFLRERDVEVNARDHKGQVPLHEASRKGHLHVVRAAAHEKLREFIAGGSQRFPARGRR